MDMDMYIVMVILMDLNDEWWWWLFYLFSLYNIYLLFQSRIYVCCLVWSWMLRYFSAYQSFFFIYIYIIDKSISSSLFYCSLPILFLFYNNPPAHRVWFGDGEIDTFVIILGYLGWPEMIFWLFTSGMGCVHRLQERRVHRRWFDMFRSYRHRSDFADRSGGCWIMLVESGSRGRRAELSETFPQRPKLVHIILITFFC